MRTLEDIRKEGSLHWTIDRIEHDGYHKVYVAGAPFPIKGVSSPEDLLAINGLKSSLKRGRVGECPEKDDYVPCAKALGEFLSVFFRKLGMNPGKSHVFAHIVHYDSAYRYRLQDMANEASENVLYSHPVREIRRVLNLSLQRDNSSVTSKTKWPFRILPYVFLIPRLRKALRSAIYLGSIKNMAMDEGDIYWAYQRTDYDFGGMPYWDRLQFLRDKGYKLSEGKR